MNKSSHFFKTIQSKMFFAGKCTETALFELSNEIYNFLKPELNLIKAYMYKGTFLFFKDKRSENNTKCALKSFRESHRVV